ncbi:ABC transporter substrate-binding protein, partial [bacterium]|nr:ABC transporter substrate-binding protein [bacterium]
MEKLIKSITIGIICIFTVFLVDLHAQGDGTDPITNSGKKWRIGYVEGGPYSNYQAILKSMIEDLMNSGWIEPAAIPECQDEVETLTLWNFLSTKIQSDYLEFPSDAYW